MLVVWTLLWSPFSADGLPNSTISVLNELWHSTGGPNWVDCGGWTPGDDPCDSQYSICFGCNADGTTLTVLDLGESNLNPELVWWQNRMVQVFLVFASFCSCVDLN